jgi:CBS domain-containing protein
MDGVTAKRRKNMTDSILTVGDIARRRPVVSVSIKTPVSEVLQSMVKNRVTAVCVLRRDKLVGIFTMKDVMQRVLGYMPGSWWGALKRKKIKDVPVGVLMTDEPIISGADISPAAALKQMQVHGIRHLPIVDQENLVGLVNIRDLIGVLRHEERKTRRKKDKRLLESLYAHEMQLSAATVRK